MADNHAHHVTVLEKLVKQWTEDSNLLHAPDLAFFRTFLESLGANIPALVAEDPDAWMQAKGRAMDAQSDGNWAEAIKHWSVAIAKNPGKIDKKCVCSLFLSFPSLHVLPK